MRVVRAGIGAAGVLLMLVGLWHLSVDSPDARALVSLGLFAVGGVLAHDLVLAPLVVLLGALLPLLPGPWRRPTIVGLVVLGSVTLMAVPVLGRFGAKPDDPSLLNRPYGLLWVGFATLVVVAVVTAGLVDVLLRRRRRVRPGSNTRSG